MFKTIDRYIIKKFLGTFFYLVLLFLAIAIVIDITEKIDDFVEHRLSIWIIIRDYYVHFIPWIGLLLSPIFVLISVIFFTSRLTNNTEITCMLNGGISFYRLLIPYMIAAIFLTGLFYYCNHYLLPKSNLERIDFEQEYVYTKRKKRDRNLHLQIGQDSLLYLQNYNERNDIGYKFSLEIINDKVLQYKLSADKIIWRGDSIGWEIKNWVERFQQSHREIIAEDKKDHRLLGFIPEDLKKKIDYKEAMTTPELEAYIAEEKRKGATDVEFYEVEKYRRTAVPFGTIILTLIAVSMTTKKVRNGMGIYIVSGLLISGLYVLLQQFSAVFSTKGSLDPILGSWIPNIIFGIVSIFLIFRAPK